MVEPPVPGTGLRERLGHPRLRSPEQQSRSPGRRRRGGVTILDRVGGPRRADREAPLDKTLKVYLSSTWADLQWHRRSAYDAMRALGLDVIGMEDYVSRDERPVEYCLKDVAACDLYVGLFAYRYGSVPEAGNPGRLSITELEYRTAGEKRIPRLIFMVPEDADWHMAHVDAVTGDGEHGLHIRRLRAELAGAHTVRHFTTPDQLRAAVGESVSRRLQERGAWRGPAPTPVTHPREIGTDLLLLHAPADDETAEELKLRLGVVHRVRSSNAALTATAADLAVLDDLVASARAVAVLLSDVALRTMDDDPDRSRRVLDLARGRTGTLLGVAEHPVAEDVRRRLGLTGVVTSGGGSRETALSALAGGLHTALTRHVPATPWPQVGVPVVVVAMTRDEAREVLADPPGPLRDLLGPLGADASDRLLARYAESRAGWRPFADSGESVQDLLTRAVDQANRDPAPLGGRGIMLRPYPFDALLTDNLAMWPVYDKIARMGCLLVLDELSLCHPELRRVFRASPFAGSDQTALVGLSPLDPAAGTPHERFREHLTSWLLTADHRFRVGLDPLCELGVPRRPNLERWLRGSLPRTLDVVRDAPRDERKLRDFASELHAHPSPAMSRLIAGEGLA
ncbi:hypothetical protein Sme01_63450 [Sphaerisporangium melleum]|uniref:DUF4062 domain-containing protein n=1 Tax=Sphaerisporangium melleum TaxID=321316 RepID=A0A917RRQ4_9ACTN|nr:DUF4062 domain-containing protein [Sphaerisporangium melleum]GGL21695.1 hypothetical protein GCM10007964_74540 [Sphaerisporangium melleum]GII73869.1 hypothetical protein Sme01_63450 [Sphaerisporangium melleum]